MKFIKIIIGLFLLLSMKEITAQITLNDATFTITAVDNFTGTVLNTGLWCPNMCFSNEGDQVIYDAANVTVTGGWLKLKCEDLRAAPVTSNSTTWNFRSGAIANNFPSIKYGYWEMSAKLPVGKGFWPAFWTLGDCQTTNVYNEIDIVENNGAQSISGTEMAMHVLWGLVCTNTTGTSPITSPATVESITNEHKYAVFWEKGKVTWYFDDKEVGRVYDAAYPPENASGTLLTFDIDNFPRDPDGTTVFPAYFEVNYIKISQLVPDCNNEESICNFNYITYDYKVKKSISVGGSSCSSTINTSNNVNLWATDFILLDEGTTINGNGSGSFSAITTLCPN